MTRLSRAICLGAILGVVAGQPVTAFAAPPDISGMWATDFRVHSSGFPLMGGVTPWVPVSQGDPAKVHMMSLDELSAITDRSVREHHGNPMAGQPRPSPPPLSDAGKRVYAKIDPKAMQDREVACYPTNVVWRIGMGAVAIVQSTPAIAMIYDGALARTVYLDGRREADALPQWNGHSVGRWDGDTLKVTTTKIRGEAFGLANWPMTENATVDEDYHLTQGGKRLELRETFFDPAYYAEPVRRLVYYHRMPATDEVLDYTCEEGKADMIEMQAKPQP